MKHQGRLIRLSVSSSSCFLVIVRKKGAFFCNWESWRMCRSTERLGTVPLHCLRKNGVVSPWVKNQSSGKFHMASWQDPIQKMVDSLCGYVSFPEWENHVLHVCCELIHPVTFGNTNLQKIPSFVGRPTLKTGFFWGRPAGKQTFDWSVMPKIRHWQWISLPKTNIAPEKKWLEDYFLRPFFRGNVIFRVCNPSEN